MNLLCCRHCGRDLFDSGVSQEVTYTVVAELIIYTESDLNDPRPGENLEELDQCDYKYGNYYCRQCGETLGLDEVKEYVKYMERRNGY